LGGVPITIKDTLNVTGWPTRRGSRTTSDAAAPSDAASIARLRSAGAVFLGREESRARERGQARTKPRKASSGQKEMLMPIEGRSRRKSVG